MAADKIKNLIQQAYNESGRLCFVSNSCTVHAIGNLRNKLQGYASILESDLFNNEVIGRLNKALSEASKF